MKNQYLFKFLTICMMLFYSQFVEANNTEIINNAFQEYSNLNDKIDTSKYGKLVEYKINNISLEDLIQANNTENKALEFINKQVENVNKIETNQKQEKQTAKLAETIQQNIKDINSIEIKSSLTLKESFLESSKSALDLLKATPTIAKYEAKILAPGSSKVFSSITKALNKVPSNISNASVAVDLLEFGKSFSNILVPLFKKKPSELSHDDFGNFLTSFNEINQSLEKLKVNTGLSKLTSSGNTLVAIESAINSIKNGIIQYEIYNNLNNLKEDNLLSKRAHYLLKNKIDNDMYGNLYNTITSLSTIAESLGFTNNLTQKANETLSDFKTIRDVFTNGQDRTLERAFNDIYTAKVTRNELMLNTSKDIKTVYTIFQDDYNKEKLSEIDEKNDELNEKIRKSEHKVNQIEKLKQKRDSLTKKISDIETYALNFEEGSQERNDALKEWESLMSVRDGILDEIKDLSREVSEESVLINKLQQDILVLMNSLEDTTSDYNNDTKIEFASDRQPYWTGEYTTIGYTEDGSGNQIIQNGGSGEAETGSSSPKSGVNLKFIDDYDERTGTILTNSSFGNYDYVAWGTWSDDNISPNGGDKAYTSHWFLVNRTTRDEIPTQGSATYNGELAGTAWTKNVANSQFEVNGNVAITANFGTNKIGGIYTIKNASDNTTWATASFSNATIQKDNEGVFFETSLSGAGIDSSKSSSFGIFAGDRAQEIGGSFNVVKGTGSNGDDRARGVFRAKK